MKIASKDIRGIFKNQITPTTTLSIGDIQDVVKSHYFLSADDKAPHTKTRPTVYPLWKHRVQGVLSDLKRKNQIKHNAATNEYTF